MFSGFLVEEWDWSPERAYAYVQGVESGKIKTMTQEEQYHYLVEEEGWSPSHARFYQEREGKMA